MYFAEIIKLFIVITQISEVTNVRHMLCEIDITIINLATATTWINCVLATYRKHHLLQLTQQNMSKRNQCLHGESSS